MIRQHELRRRFRPGLYDPPPFRFLTESEQAGRLAAEVRHLPVDRLMLKLFFGSPAPHVVRRRVRNALADLVQHGRGVE